MLVGEPALYYSESRKIDWVGNLSLLERQGLIKDAKSGVWLRQAEGVLVWSTRDPLCGRTVKQFEAALREKLVGRVEQAWLFGSCGTPAFGADSDRSDAGRGCRQALP